MKNLQSLKIKITTLVLFFTLSACASNPKQLVDYEPCSVASNAKPLSSNEFYDAFALCREQATEGNPVSQKNLAYIYYFGTPNLPKDEEKGMYWLKVAADNGSATAQERLALIGEWIKLGQYGSSWKQKK